jgi:hypothetical protein
MSAATRQRIEALNGPHGLGDVARTQQRVFLCKLKDGLSQVWGYGSMLQSRVRYQ